MAVRSYVDRFSLAGRVALVTGSGGGIGRVLAAAFGEAGAVVALHDRTPDQLTEASTFLKDNGIEFLSFSADLANVEECRRLIGDVQTRLGQLDILVNCAGANRRQSIDEVEPDTFDWIVSVNARAPYFLSQAAHRVMKSQGGGRIINIGSLNSFYGLHGVSVYGLTKGAINQMTKTMAAEWAPDNVQVNCLTPGFIVTPMNEDSLWGVPRRRAWMLDRVPAGRPGLPDDLVGAALFLASDASAFVTGQTLVVDGGFLGGGSWEYQGPGRE